MRFHFDGPAIPDVLLERCDAGRVVFLCGAGVSLPSGMPTFVGLTQHVIDFFDPPVDSEIMVAFRPWLINDSAANVPLYQIINLLHLEYGKDEVNALVTERLSAPLEKEDFGREHGLLKRISSNQSGGPQIVTTNFDRLFEAGREEKHFDLHVPPAFPDLNFGSTIEGITYLHGRLVEGTSSSHPYVLSSADFGRAYLSEGWATNFIRHLLERYTVVLVGYQAEDPPIKYLLQGLNHDGKYDRSKLYAFDRGLPEEVEAKWRDRGVTAIAYSTHSDLWKSMDSWADRADDPRAWRATIISKCQQDPKEMAPHERGQVAHVLRTVQGAKLFSEADPKSHPEWVCVFDAYVRSAKPSRGYGEGAEVFDPRAAYGLDDDLANISDDDLRLGASNDNLFVWREEDDNPTDFHRLGGAFGTIPKRLLHLINWIGNSMDSPVLAWWAIQQSGLHPRLLQTFEGQVKHSKDLSKRARHIWRLILEHQKDPRSFQWNGEWFDLKSRLSTEGWTASVLRELRQAGAPRLEIKPPYGLGNSKPPSVPWELIQLSHLGQFDVVFLQRHGDNMDIPDDFLSKVVGILEGHLIIASGLLEDIETFYFDTPTYYPHRDTDGEAYRPLSAEFVMWFSELFDRLIDKQPKLANAHLSTWPLAERFFFRKLRLYAFSKSNAFGADQVAKEVLSFPQEIFWDLRIARELLFLLVDRWKEFSQSYRNQLVGRILAGPDQLSNYSDDEYPRIRDEFGARYGRYLDLQACELTANFRQRLSKMISCIPEWSDSWATSTVKEYGSRGGVIGTDEKPDALVNLPVDEIVSRAKADLTREFGSLVEKRPFTGLVKSNPRKALSALTVAGKMGDYTKEFWSSMIDDLAPDAVPRLRRVFLNRVARLPYAVIADLRHMLGRWLEQNLTKVLEFDNVLGWAVYDHIVDGFLSAEIGASEINTNGVHENGKFSKRSRRTFGTAINGPIGLCVTALFNVVSKETEQATPSLDSHIKVRIERLLASPGEGSDHAVSIACNQLNWLAFIDPVWTTETLIPMFEFKHPASEPAWSGLLHNGREPSSLMIAQIKPLLLNLFPWVEGFSWNHDVSHIAAQWLGLMRIFPQDEKSGLSSVEMRFVLRVMSDENRNKFIVWLGQVGQQNENGWIEHVIPLINNDWPRERRYRTSTSMRAWITLLGNSRDSFAAVFDAVKKFLVPVETHEQPFYQFTRAINDEKSITELFPETTLDLMYRATPQNLSRSPFELAQVLVLIAETEPGLISDSRYLRLIDLVERS